MYKIRPGLPNGWGKYLCISWEQVRIHKENYNLLTLEEKKSHTHRQVESIDIVTIHLSD